jgi:hypothetical protein
MSRANPYPLEPMSTKIGHKGLTQRLAEKAEAKQRVFLPLYSVPQVKDVKR